MFVCAHWGAVGEFAASRHGAVSRQQAAELGLSAKVIARYLREGHLTEPISGVLVVTEAPPTWHQQLTIATLGSRSAARIGFGAAAALHRLDGYSPGPVDFIVPNWRNQLEAAGNMHVGSIDSRDATTADGIRCTGIARTLIDIASIDPLDKVTLAFESAWRRGVSLRWIEETAQRLRRPRQRGNTLILDLVQQARQHRVPTDSALELRLEACLRDVPGLVRQHSVHDSTGAFVARTDFAVPHSRVAIEAHSRQFHFGPDIVAHDEQREHALRMNGWEVLFFGHESTKKPAHVQAQVLAAIQRQYSRAAT